MPEAGVGRVVNATRTSSRSTPRTAGWTSGGVSNDPTLSGPREADVVRPRVCPKPQPTVACVCEYDLEARRVVLTCLVHFEQAFIHFGPALHMSRDRVQLR